MGSGARGAPARSAEGGVTASGRTDGLVVDAQAFGGLQALQTRASVETMGMIVWSTDNLQVCANTCFARSGSTSRGSRRVELMSSLPDVLARACLQRSASAHSGIEPHLDIQLYGQSCTFGSSREVPILYFKQNLDCFKLCCIV